MAGPTSSVRTDLGRASRERTVAEPSGARPPEGLYVHFPFCLSVCPYCDFVVVAGAAARGPQSRVDALVAALAVELELRADAVEEAFGYDRPPLRSVYLGGGTPSLMHPAQVAALLAAIDRRLGLAPDAEITLEANPGPGEVGDLAGFRAAGVGRLSLGAQSMQAGELRRLGRRHRPEDVREAVAGARAAGFGSISLDLLTDIPGQTLVSWRDTLGSALALAPDHLSVYTLTLDDPEAEGLTGPEGDHLPLSRGARAWRERALVEQSDERAAEMELMTDELAAPAGLERYEIANLARPGQQSGHNLLYWRRRPYLALGPGAHASDGALRRTWNAARLDRYLEALERRSLPPGGAEEVDPATAQAETAILGLRLREGIPRALAAAPGIAEGLAWARAHGLVEDHPPSQDDRRGPRAGPPGRVRLTSEGRLLANEVFARLLPDPPPPAGTGPGT